MKIKKLACLLLTGMMVVSCLPSVTVSAQEEAEMQSVEKQNNRGL